MEKHFQNLQPFFILSGYMFEAFLSFIQWNRSTQGPESCRKKLRCKKTKGARMHIRTAASRQPTDTCDEAVAHAVSQHPTYWRDSPHASKKREIKKGPAVQYYRCWVKYCRLQTASKDDKCKISTTQQYKDFQDIG